MNGMGPSGVSNRQAYAAARSGADDSDFRAVNDGFISVTPLSLDLTHTRMLEEATSWWTELT